MLMIWCIESVHNNGIPLSSNFFSLGINIVQKSFLDFEYYLGDLLPCGLFL